MNDDDEIAVPIFDEEQGEFDLRQPVEPEALMDKHEAEAYLDEHCANWREFRPTPPAVMAFGQLSFSKKDLDDWLKSCSSWVQGGDDRGVQL